MAAIDDRSAAPEIESIDPNAVKKELLSKYPTKVARKRAKQIIINKVGDDCAAPEIGANSRAIPGIITSADAVMQAAREWCWGLPGIS